MEALAMTYVIYIKTVKIEKQAEGLSGKNTFWHPCWHSTDSSLAICKRFICWLNTHFIKFKENKNMFCCICKKNLKCKNRSIKADLSKNSCYAISQGTMHFWIRTRKIWMKSSMLCIWHNKNFDYIYLISPQIVYYLALW